MMKKINTPLKTKTISKIELSPPRDRVPASPCSECADDGITKKKIMKSENKRQFLI